MANVYEIVTSNITKALERGVCAWRKPWNADTVHPMNITGRRYSGANYFILSIMGDHPVWLTANQIRQHGGKIKNGEERKAMPVVFWKWLPKQDDPDGKFPMIRFFNVWNYSQTEGIELPNAIASKITNSALIKHTGTNGAADTIINSMPNAPKMVIQASDRACYRPSTDTVTVPLREQFNDLNEFYSTMFHELTHSTGHKSRLNRKEIEEPTFFGSHGYSNEELVAELGAAFLCAESGVDNTLENSAAYIQGWLKRLTSDPKAFVTAAGKAQKAADYILNRKASEEPKGE